MAPATIPEPYYNDDKTSFAYISARERWPVILTGAVDDIHRTITNIPQGGDEKVEEGKHIVSRLVALKHDLEHDRELVKFDESKADVYGDDIIEYNRELESLPAEHKSWLTAPWLYAECYMYKLLSTFFTDSKHWKGYDMFQRQKDDTFRASQKAVAELCKRYSALQDQLSAISKDGQGAAEALKVLFHEFTDISLWGNATDLSLLTNVSLEDIQALQGAETRKKNEKNVIVNDIDQAWDALNVRQGGRVDIVLDNAGFELFTDLIYVLFLLDSKVADTVVLHPKLIPWFVSDVLPSDFANIFNQMKDPNFFESKVESLDLVANKLAQYHENGQLIIRTSPFWTSAKPFWEIREGGKCGGDAVRKDLLESKLVIFKGDLNHRKLLFDLAWPRTTKFTEAIGPAASNGVKIFTLRTCKADTCTGLPEGKEEDLEKEWLALGHTNPREWCWMGKYAVVQFSSGNN
uniref:Sugar phosphate phosphatase n=1 Tax=Blastobotrys adeninivorans TaxID=409370 RepID=A0A060SXL4_BLAAD